MGGADSALDGRCYGQNLERTRKGNMIGTHMKGRKRTYTNSMEEGSSGNREPYRASRGHDREWKFDTATIASRRDPLTSPIINTFNLTEGQVDALKVWQIDMVDFTLPTCVEDPMADAVHSSGLAVDVRNGMLYALSIATGAEDAPDAGMPAWCVACVEWTRKLGDAARAAAQVQTGATTSVKTHKKRVRPAHDHI